MYLVVVGKLCKRKNMDTHIKLILSYASVYFRGSAWAYIIIILTFIHMKPSVCDMFVQNIATFENKLVI